MIDAPALVDAAIDRTTERVMAQGKFLTVDGRTLYVRGVTYGTFAVNDQGVEMLDHRRVEEDFIAMAAVGINTVRVYTVPPVWLLDLALAQGLRVIVGLPWAQHIAFLDDRAHARAIDDSVREGVRACARHPAVLCYAVGNEIPAPIVRWLGRHRIERFIHRLYRAAKLEDPGALVTYVNYPSTEYLELPFLDFMAFNVYLETPEKLSSYLARLQNLAGERPLMMMEIGLDSRRNGEQKQAETLDWQVRSVFAAGCVGAVVFAWTDEWHRGGSPIEDWDFGLTDRRREPKPALATVRDAFSEVPFPVDTRWPSVSVVVCSYNGSRTIRDTLEALERLDYPDYEVIVIDDGSTDSTAAIAGAYGRVSLISTENRGLSNARNLGLAEATGDLVAYTDDDAYPDPRWLKYLAWTFLHSDHAGVGGPNIAPPGDGAIADCIANAPGGPVHVLLSDSVAEHIPGCNMAFRRERLLAIGGFDPRFRNAGDDVDVCWRLQERGWTLGFSPAAMVWHHRRNSVRTYWKQQQGYGKAEALLEGKWPEKYNAPGHVSWQGRLYGRGLTEAMASRRGRVYHGIAGSGLFQSLYAPAPGLLASLPLMPEWYLVVAALIGLSLLGALAWAPLLLALPLLLLALAAPIWQAVISARRATFPAPAASPVAAVRRRALTAFLHVIQPVARLHGRLRHGLTPWRRRVSWRPDLPIPRQTTLWNEQWRSLEQHLALLRLHLTESKVNAREGDGEKRDLAVTGGLFGGANLLATVEEHGAGRQLVRYRWWPSFSVAGLTLIAGSAGLAIAAGLDDAPVAAFILGATGVLLALRAFLDAGRACRAIHLGVAAMSEAEQHE